MEVDTNELLHRIGAVLRVMSDKMDRLIAIGERVEGEVRLPSELEAQTFADAKEPPKKWRILHPGESVRASDWENEDLNSETDPPDGPGWRPASMWKNGRSVLKDDKCIYARPVADEPAKKPEPEHPAGPKPDPGEGYRIVSKDPPEDLQPGDDYELAPGVWVTSEHARTHKIQYEDIWYRRKIETAKPAWEPKVGDWVKVTRPEDWRKSRFPHWDSEMHKFDGQVGQIEREREGHFQIRGFVASKEWQYIFHRDWLSPATTSQPLKLPPSLATVSGSGGRESKPYLEDEYREPVVPADAGKVCQFSDDGQNWLSGWVYGWVPDRNWVTLNNSSWKYCRIKKDA